MPFNVAEMVELPSAATGFSYTPQRYLTTGERIWNLTEMFNVCKGISARDDVLPEILHGETAGRLCQGLVDLQRYA